MFNILSLTLSAAAVLGDTTAVEYYSPTVSCPSSPLEDCATEEANDATNGSVYTEPPLQFPFGTMAPERERRRLAMPKGSSAHRVLRIEDDDSGDNEYDSDDDDDSDSDDDDESDEYKDEKRLFLDNDPKFKDLYDSMTDHAARDEMYSDVKEESELASMLDPRARYTWSHEQLHAYFGCERSFAFTRPLYDDGMWTELRQLWRDFAEEDKRGPLPPRGGEPERTHRLGTGSFEPPMEPFQTGERGRGLRATRDIARGELVFEATNNTIVFTRGHTFRLFLFHIYTRHNEDSLLDSGTTCDALVWPWVQTLEENGDPIILFDFDNGSLLNAGRDEDGWDPPNIRCGKEGDSMCMMEYYATKDIKPGDEILCDYSDFVMFDFWEMGL